MAVTIFSPYEPKATNRFIFYIDELLGIPSYLIKATTLPAIDNGEIKINYINHNFKVKSLSTWQDIDLTLYDPVDPSAAKKVRNWVIQHHMSTLGIDGYAFGFNPFPNQDGLLGVLGDLLGGIAPANIIDSPLGYKKNVAIKYVDPKGKEFEGWKIMGAYIKTSNWGELDWSRGDALEIKLTLAYDYAVLL